MSSVRSFSRLAMQIPVVAKAQKILHRQPKRVHENAPLTLAS